MTITSTAYTTTVAGNGATTTFSYPFSVYSASTVSLVYKDAGGVQTTLTPSLWSITGAAVGGTGGTFTYPLSGSPIAAGTTLTLRRTTPVVQDTSLPPAGPAYPPSVEAALDDLTMMVQEIPSYGLTPSTVTVAPVLNPFLASATLALARTNLDVPAATGGTMTGGTFTSSTITSSTITSSTITSSTITGGTMTGGTITSSTIDSVNGGAVAGFRNRLINGNFVVDQRNSGAAQPIVAGAALAYTADRWYAYCTTANVTGQRIAGAYPSQYRYRFTGAASATAIGFAQRLAAEGTFEMAATNVLFGVDISNTLLTSVAWAVYYASTTDSFGTLASPTRTLIASGTFTVTNTIARYSATVAIPAAAITGLELVMTVGAQVSGTWTIGDVQLEPGTVATPFERRPVGIETGLCQRYYYSLPIAVGFAANASGGGQGYYTLIPMPVAMRVTPAHTPSYGAMTNITSNSTSLSPSLVQYQFNSTAAGVMATTISNGNFYNAEI